MFNVGNFVSFHSINDEFEYVNDIERFIDDTTFYEIVDKLSDENDNLDSIVVINNQGMRISVEIDEYQIHTKESLRDTIKSKNYKYADICKKIKQLYRKHNNSDSSFKFQGV